MGDLPLGTAVQGDMLDICPPTVLSTDFPRQGGRAPDRSLLPALGRCLGLSLLYHRVELQAPLANTSMGAVL